jgi:GTP-binding protein Era
MVEAAHAALAEAHAVLHLHPAKEAPAPRLDGLLAPAAGLTLPAQRLVVLTQVDRLELSSIATDPGSLRVSAVTGQGIPELLAWCREAVPEGPFRHAPDDISTQPVRFFAEEYVREAAFECLEDELPYAVAAEVEEFREDSDPVYIRMTVHVERDSQRGIVVGRGGRTIRTIGTTARIRIEHLLDRPVFLDLRVKVLPKWRTRPQSLQRLGFPAPSKERA